MTMIEKVMLFIATCMVLAAIVQAILLLRVVTRKKFNEVIPMYEMARQNRLKEKAGRENEEWVYIDNQGFIILNWRNLNQDELKKLHYIPKKDLYNVQQQLIAAT